MHPIAARSTRRKNMVARTETVVWILASGVLMSLLALVGSIVLLLGEETVRRMTLTLVSFSSGALIGGALFHMLPVSVAELSKNAENGPMSLTPYALVSLGMISFILLQQYITHHLATHRYVHQFCEECQERHDVHGVQDISLREIEKEDEERRTPNSQNISQDAGKEKKELRDLCWVVLLGDAIHNFIGGAAISAVFLVDISTGIATWLAGASHEIPQEIGDFGVLLHAGWPPKKALWYNFLAALPFLFGGMIVAVLGDTFLVVAPHVVAFGAGNFLFIGASLLLPEVLRAHHHHLHTASLRKAVMNFGVFCLGLVVLLVIRILFKGW